MLGGCALTFDDSTAERGAGGGALEMGLGSHRITDDSSRLPGKSRNRDGHKYYTQGISDYTKSVYVPIPCSSVLGLHHRHPAHIADRDRPHRCR